MGESTKNPKESIPPEAWSYDAFRASRVVPTFDEPRSLEGDLKAINRRSGEVLELEAKIREHERRCQETGKPIAEHEAVALVERIKSLTPHFDGCADYIAFLAGECLTLQEGQAAGEVFVTSVRWEAGAETFRQDLVMLAAELKAEGAPRLWERAERAAQKLKLKPEKAAEAARWCGRETAARKAAGWWRTVALAVPAVLRFSGPDSAFGVRSASWLHQQYEAVARERARRDFPPGSPASRMYDGGDFAIPIFDVPALPPVRPGYAVPVVPAPVEDKTREYIERARSCPDHWNALARVVDVLTKCRQPLGDALTDWVVQRGNRPDGRKAAETPAKAIRNHAIIEAVRALERCGMQATRNDVSPPRSACDAVGKAFSLSYDTVRGIWKDRLRPEKQGISCG